MSSMLHGDETKVGASYVGKRAKDNPREMVIRLIEENPSWSKDALFTKFEAALDGTPAFQQAVNWYFFVNMYEYERLAARSSRTQQTRIQDTADHQAIVERVKDQVAQIVLLDLMLPTGKLLRDSTFKECANVGGWFAKLAKLGKPNEIVGNKLTEDKIRMIWNGK